MAVFWDVQMESVSCEFHAGCLAMDLATNLVQRRDDIGQVAHICGRGVLNEDCFRFGKNLIAAERELVDLVA